VLGDLERVLQMKMKSKALALAAVISIMTTGFAFAEDGTVWDPDNITGIRHSYMYSDNQQIELVLKPLVLTDIKLREGESVESISAGDTSRWQVEVVDVAGTPHVYVKPTTTNIRTNMIITTNERSYRYVLTTGEHPEYYVDYIYPDTTPDSVKGVKAGWEREEQRINAIMKAEENARKALSGYKIKQNHNVYEFEQPQFMFDDGTKTYIKINKENKNNLPTIYYYDSRIPKDKLQLVNYRIKGDFFEIDRVAQAWKIVYEQNAYLIVERPVKAKKSKNKVLNQGNLHQEMAAAYDSKINTPRKIQLSAERPNFTSAEMQKINAIDQAVDKAVNAKLEDKEVIVDTSTAAPTTTQSQEVDLQSALSDIRNQRAQATL
jgi:P-type conjugative transfer protein TrbG